MALSKTASQYGHKEDETEPRLTFDRSPFDLFSDILLLLSLERELNEDLLKLFIDVVDAQLLERVVLEDLETAGTSQRPGIEFFASAE